MRTHYHWIIVIITGFSILLSGTLVASGMFFITVFDKYFGWDSSITSFGIVLCLLICSISSPFLAATIEKNGLKKVMLLSMATLFIGILLTFFMSEPWQFIIIWGLIIGLGTSVFFAAIIPYVANQWFKDKYALIVGILSSATILGKIILFPILALLIDHISWKWAMGVFLVLIAILSFLILFFIKNSPKDIGILPYGVKENYYTEPLDMNNSSIFSTTLNGLFEAFRTKEFWLLVCVCITCGIGTGGIFQEISSYNLNINESLLSTVSLTSSLISLNIIATLISGLLSDIYDNRSIMFFFFAILGCSSIFVAFSFVLDMSILFMFSMFTLLNGLIIVPPTITIIKNKFGVQKTPIIFGWIFMFYQIGAVINSYYGYYLYKYLTVPIAQNLGMESWFSFKGGFYCILAIIFFIWMKKSPQKINNKLVKED